MMASAWLSIKTQPIGTDDELSCLSQAPDVEASARRELKIAGPDVLSHGERHLCRWERERRYGRCTAIPHRRRVVACNGDEDERRPAHTQAIGRNVSLVAPRGRPCTNT
jgi:hypothetical protein